MIALLPARLRSGDVIGVVSPASALDEPSRLEAGVRYLEGLGYRVMVGEHVGKRTGYLAGTDDERAADINRMFADRRVNAIFCLRGGYGTPRILPYLRYSVIRKNPKILVGYSDITALQFALWRRCALVTYQGPMVGVDMLGHMEPLTEESFWKTLTHPSRGMVIGTGQTLVRGTGKAIRHGRRVGGNLSLIVSLLGSKYSPSFRDTLFLVEEIGEEPYRIDRMLMHLTMTGQLAGVSAMAAGSLTDCEARDHFSSSPGPELVLTEYAVRNGIPLVAGLPFGHRKEMITLPLGAAGKLDLASGTLIRSGASVR
jgi:muramoyltetrapeptide carboxypeptidase